MIRKFLSVVLVCMCGYASAQVIKPDFVRTPNGPNTIVDWNVKFKTMILPHYLLTARPTSQDTVGTIFLNIDPTDTHIYIRGVAGSYMAIANLSDVSGNSVDVPFTATTGATINWQTDIVPGYSVTYAVKFGNNPNPFVYFGGSPGGQPFSITYSGSLISTMVFDFGTVQTGYIRF